MKKSNKGFTLIELMVVIMIIAIIVAIMLPSFMTARARAKYTTCISNVKNLGTALESYHAQRMRYPTEEEFKTSYNNGLDGFINHVPLCPSSGKEYVYTTTLDEKGYKLSCKEGVRAHLVIIPNDGYPQFSSAEQLQDGKALIANP